MEKRAQTESLGQNANESSVTSHHGKVQVELEDGTLEDVDLLSYLDTAGRKQRCLQAEIPTKKILKDVSKKSTPPSNIYTTTDRRERMTRRAKELGKIKKKHHLGLQRS